MASSGSFSCLTQEEVRSKRTVKLESGRGHVVDDSISNVSVVQPSSGQESGDYQQDMDVTETDSVPPANQSRGKSSDLAITGKKLGRDPETYLSDTTGWQFYLDYLASRLSANISEMSVYLGLESAKFDEIKIRCKSNRHEMCFNVLWAWYTRNTDNKERIKEINTALKESGRVDLANELTEGKVPNPKDYRYSCEINDKVSSGDAIKVSKHLTLTFQSLARYFGLDENNIQRICADNSDDIQEQSYRTIDLCIRQQKLTSRQQLCDGLAYIEQYTTISELQQNW